METTAKTLNQKTIFNVILFISLISFSVQTYSQGGAAINSTGAASDPSAMLDVSSSNSGFLLPRMTTAERNTISNPAQGLQIINTTTNCIEVFFSPIWQTIFCGCNPPASPAAGIHTPSQTGIIWDWNVVSGATGYKYNTVDDFSSAIDNGSNTGFTQTGLSCNTSYTLYVWAYSACGNSSSISLTQSTLPCFNCGDNVSFTYNGSNVTYASVYGANNTCWLDRNLGAFQVATSITDGQAYGDLFQWGRLDDNHQDRGSFVTSTPSSTDVPGHSYFISGNTWPNDWRIPQNDNLWQGVNGINNPCPAGWRLPTDTELDNEKNSWGSQNLTGAFNSNLKWTAAGSRYRDGSNWQIGSRAFIWSSNGSGGNGYYLEVQSGAALINVDNRASALTVRCIKD